MEENRRSLLENLFVVRKLLIEIVESVRDKVQLHCFSWFIYKCLGYLFHHVWKGNERNSWNTIERGEFICRGITKYCEVCKYPSDLSLQNHQIRLSLRVMYNAKCDLDTVAILAHCFNRLIGRFRRQTCQLHVSSHKRLHVRLLLFVERVWLN